MKSLLIKHFLNFVNFYNHILNKFFNKSNPICRIEEINLERKIIVIHCRGINSPIKFSLDEVIQDPVILSNLSPKQASWIGYYYGKYYKNKKNYDTFINFSIDEKESDRFKMKMLDRQGNVIYCHGDKLYTIQPIKALNNESIINSFTPIQACYIGILAGTSTKKTRTNQANKTYLKIVK